MNSIDIFPWNENFNTGVPQIDEQHQKLVRLLNRLASHFGFQSDPLELNLIFDELTAYSVYHFHTEDTIWHEYFQDDATELKHKEYHESFITNILKFKTELEERSASAVVEEILNYLTRWLASHILENDRYMAMIVFALQSGASMAQAREQAKQQLDGTMRVLIEIILSTYGSLTANTLQLMRELAEHKRDRIFLEKLLLAVEQSPNSIIITDLNANIEFVNETFLKTTGYSRSEVIGQNPRIFQSGETPRETYANMWETLTSGKIWKGELTNRRKDGSFYNEQALITPVFQSDANPTNYIAIKEDISARKLADSRIQSLLHEQKLMLENDLVGIVKTKDRLFIWGNPIAEKTLGYDVGELVGAPARKVYVSDEAYSEFGIAAYPIINSGGVYKTQIEFVRKDGSLIWVDLRGVMQDSTINESLWIFVDITDRKQAEVIIQQSEEKFRSIFDCSNDALIFMIGGRFVEGNQRSLEMFCLDSLDELKAVTPIELSPIYQPDGEKSSQAINRHMTKAYAKGFDRFEWTYRRKTGEEFPAEIGLYAFNLHSRSMLLVDVRDITERKQAERLLADSENKYRSLIELAGDAIFIADTATGTIIDCNKSASELIGKTKEEIIGINQSQLHPPDIADNYKNIFKNHVDSGNFFSEDIRVSHKDGHAIPVDIKTSVINLNGASVIMGICRNITDRKLAEVEMRVAATAFESRQGMMITDADKAIVRVNKTFSYITGYSAEELYGANPRMLGSGRQDELFYAEMWESINKKGAWEGEIWNRRKSGDIYPEYLTITAVKDKDGEITNYVSTHTDITQLKQHQLEVEHIAYHDPLTELPNRRLLADRMRQALSRAKRVNQSVCVVCIDLDGFKEVNDVLGHEVGDRLLISVASRLQHCVRDDDTISRLGGDEFVLLLGEIRNRNDCEQTLKQVLTELAIPFNLGEDKVANISGSIGYTLFPDDDVDADTLLRHADHAMYAAKQAGKNRYHLFDLQKDNRIKANWGALHKIDKALDKGEFCLYIQPKINLRNGQVAGAEALIRWRHPIRGLIMPMEFLPLIENHDLSLKLGDWVICEGMKILTKWRGQGLDIPLSINVSARQLREKDFSSRLGAILKKHSCVPPEKLEIEIVESAALDDINKVSLLILECRMHGVSFSLDDFGTGYSSLTYLKRLSVDTLKIDQSFVRDMLSDENALAIVRGVIGLASAFRGKTVAEGVETWSQALRLKAMGCEIIQGYAIAKPMPENQFAEWVGKFQLPEI